MRAQRHQCQRRLTPPMSYTSAEACQSAQGAEDHITGTSSCSAPKPQVRRLGLRTRTVPSAFLLPVLPDGTVGYRERTVRDGDAGVEADLEQDLLDLLLGEAVA